MLDRAGQGVVPAVPRRRIATVVAVVFAGNLVGQGFARVTLVAALPAMLGDVVGSYAQAGLLSSLSLGAYTVGLLLLGTAGARLAPERVLPAGIAGCAAGLLFAGLAPGYTALCAAMILLGFSCSGVWVPGTVVVSAVSARRGLTIGIASGGFGVAAVVSAQLARAVQARGGEGAWRPLWLIEAAITAAVLAAMLLALRRVGTTAPVPPATHRRMTAAVAALRSVPGWPALLGGYAAFGFAYTVYLTFLVVALERDAGFGTAHAAADYALYGVGSIAGGVVVGRISDVLGRRATLGGAAALQVLCVAALILHSEPWALVSTLGTGLLTPGMGTVFGAYLGDHLAGREMAVAFAAVTLAFSVTQAAGPVTGGWIADHTGSFTAPVLVSASVMGAIAAAALCLPSRRFSARREPSYDPPITSNV